MLIFWKVRDAFPRFKEFPFSTKKLLEKLGELKTIFYFVRHPSETYAPNALVKGKPITLTLLTFFNLCLNISFSFVSFTPSLPPSPPSLLTTLEPLFTLPTTVTTWVIRESCDDERDVIYSELDWNSQIWPFKLEVIEGIAFVSVKQNTTREVGFPFTTSPSPPSFLHSLFLNSLFTHHFS